MRNALFLTLTLWSFGWVNAQIVVSDQNPVPAVRCHTMEAHAAMLERNPEYESLDDFEEWLNPLIRQYREEADVNDGRSPMAVTTIPVVFHIIHDNDAVGSGDNLSAALVNAQLAQLNNDFRRILGTSGYNNNAVGADSEIEFCAAVVDPGGNTLAEPGINRINRSAQGWTAPPYGVCCGTNCFDDSYIENTIKAQSQWNPDNYLNIWVMDINCGILGYAQFPSSSGLQGLNSNGGAASTDGVVLLTSSVGSTDTPNPAGGSFNKGRTGTHEIGHFFGLRHIWGDGGCSVDDYCADTPTSDGANFGCPNTTSCGSTDMVENYMDYTNDDCMNIFTIDQKARMQTVLANSPRRGSLGVSTACTGGGGDPTCSTTISSFPYNEGFESSFGAWTQASGDDFDWSRNSGGTPSNNTGPSGANEGTFYAYVESSSPNYSDKTTILNSPCFDLSGESQATFTFDYHLYGATTMGSLTLEARAQGGSWTSVWSQTGNQGNAWAAASVDLSAYVGGIMELRYVGVTGTTWQGDMAIDDLSLSTSGGDACAGGVSSFPYTEGFESSFGGWTQDSADDFDWSRNSGGTPSNNTGPSGANEGSFYAYVESSTPNYSNKTAILNSPCFDLSGESQATLTFDYHMYGAVAMGGLELQAKSGTSWTTVWSQSGNQGNAWFGASVDLSSYIGGQLELRFVGTTGTTWQGDMAIDGLNLSTSASGGCGDVTLTITFDNYPEETSWTITSGGNTVASGGTYGSQADGSTLVLTECLEDGCYDFTISDAYGDGICCTYGNGSYTLRNANNQVLASGGSFGSSETTAFCLSNGLRSDDEAVNPVQTTPQLVVANLELFPNPVREALNVRYQSKWSGQAQLRVLDLMGRTAQVSVQNVVEGKNQYEISTDALQSGTYLLVIAKGDDLQTQRFVVLK